MRAGDGKNRVATAAVAPALFETPPPAPIPTIVLPTVPSQSGSWSMPEINRAAPQAASSSEEIPAAPADTFEMPANQQSDK
jgi:hypothetical protein